MDQVISKIKKLLALSKSPNEHEAAMAAAKAMEIMEEHQITTLELGGNERDAGVAVIRDEIIKGGRIDRWKLVIFKKLADIHDLQSMITSHRSAQRQLFESLDVIGLKGDIEVFKQTLPFIIKAIDRARKSEWDKIRDKFPAERWGLSIAHTFRKDFSLGASMRIAQRLEELKADRMSRVPKSNALVVVKKDVIQKFIDGSQIKLDGKKAMVMNKTHAFFEMGVVAGNSIQLNNQIRGGR